MGTRADFYVGRGKHAEWLGSIAWDGYPDGVPAELIKSGPLTVQDYRNAVYDLLKADPSASVPDHGWPWPWADSGTTDYAYAFDCGKLWASAFGRPWFTPDPEQENWGEPSGDEYDEYDGPKMEFPDMSKFRNVTFGRRSGLIVLGTEEGTEGS